MKGKKSKYKGVTHYYVRSRSEKTKEGYWQARKQHKGTMYSKVYKTEREAALAYDKMCLSLGLEPVNVLVKK